MNPAIRTCLAAHDGSQRLRCQPIREHLFFWDMWLVNCHFDIEWHVWRLLTWPKNLDWGEVFYTIGTHTFLEHGRYSLFKHQLKFYKDLRFFFILGLNSFWQVVEQEVNFTEKQETTDFLFIYLLKQPTSGNVTERLSIGRVLGFSTRGRNYVKM